MKKIILISFFLILYSCGGKKVYMCGDHRCIDKKEYNEYFAKNLSIEIDLEDKKERDKSIDLVKLNTEENFISDKKFNLINKNKNNRRESRLLKKKKNQEEKRIKKKILKKKKIEENNDNQKNNKVKLNIKDKIVKAKDKIIKTKTKPNIEAINDSKSSNETLIIKNRIIDNNICVDIKNCDIDKISELLIKEGSSKEFPDITLR